MGDDNKYAFSIFLQTDRSPDFVGVGIWRDTLQLEFIIRSHIEEGRWRMLVNGPVPELVAIRIYPHSCEKNLTGPLLLELSAQRIAELHRLTTDGRHVNTRSRKSLDYVSLKQQIHTFIDSIADHPTSDCRCLNIDIFRRS